MVTIFKPPPEMGAAFLYTYVHTPQFAWREGRPTRAPCLCRPVFTCYPEASITHNKETCYMLEKLHVIILNTVLHFCQLIPLNLTDCTFTLTLHTILHHQVTFSVCSVVQHFDACQNNQPQLCLCFVCVVLTGRILHAYK